MKSCRSCGFAKNDARLCALLNAKIWEPDLACQFYEKEPQCCPICGRLMLKHTGVYLSDCEIYVCASCGEDPYTCTLCRHRKQGPPACIAAQYGGPFDVIETVTFRKDNAYVQTQRINPTVIAQVCPNCTCGSPDNCQNLHTCKNWEVAINEKN